ncbi:MAG: hypothetical protein ACKOA7_01030, partial [Bacteroidota bacterium]
VFPDPLPPPTPTTKGLSRLIIVFPAQIYHGDPNLLQNPVPTEIEESHDRFIHKSCHYLRVYD